MDSNNRASLGIEKTFRVLLVLGVDDALSLELRQALEAFPNLFIQEVQNKASFERLLLQERWDVVFCKFRLDDLDIFSVAERLKVEEVRIPLIAIGEREQGEELARFLQSSISHQYIERSRLGYLTTFFHEQSGFLSESEAIQALKTTVEKQRQEIAFLQQQLLTARQYGSLALHSPPNLFSTIGIISSGADGAIVEANDVFLDMLGYTRDDLYAGKLNWRFLTPKEYWDVDDAALQQLLRYGKAVPIEKPFIHKAGHWVYVSVGAASLSVSQQLGISFVLELPKGSQRERQRASFFHALDASVVGVIRWHIDGRILEANQTFLGMLGYSKEEFEQDGLNWKSLTPPEYIARDMEAVRTLLKEGEAPSFEKQYFHKDGSRVDILIGRLSSDPEDPNEGMAFILDISHMKATERHLDEIRTNLLNAQRIAKLGSWDCNLLTREMYYSEEFYRIVGAPQGLQFETRDKFRPYVHPDDWEKWNQAIDDAIAKKSNYKSEYRLLHPSGQILHMQVQGEVEFDEEGQPTRMRGTIQDITEMKRVEEALMILSGQQEALLNNIPDMVWMKDLDLRFIAVNEKKAAHLGLPKEQVIGKTYLDFLEKERAERYHGTDREVLATGKRLLVNDSFDLPNGKTLWLEVIKSPILNADGEAIGITGIARDITDRKEYEDAMLRSNELLEKKVAERTTELLAANRTLKESEQLRNNFISSLTHDLRTPLIAQKRLIELFSEKFKNDDGQLAFLNLGLLQNNENLLEMVNKLLETYQYADGRIMIHMEKINLSELVSDCFEVLCKVAESKGIKLVNQVAVNLERVSADASQIQRVLMNLLGNALENIPRGCTVEVSAVELADMIRIDVADDGPGIEPEFLPYMFDRYSLRSRRRQKLGSGLGLFICKTIIELHQGTISVASELGQGAIFTIYLPRRNQQSKQKTETELQVGKIYRTDDE